MKTLAEAFREFQYPTPPSHPDLRSIELAGQALSAHLAAGRTTAEPAGGPQLVPTEAGVRHLRLVK
ncbi:hypothetical protein ACWEO1_19160 [Kitasatospora cineracea]